jgi:hypothetical protein
MHSGIVSWWRSRHGVCGKRFGLELQSGRPSQPWSWEGGGDGLEAVAMGKGSAASACGGLCAFLAYKLELDERQVAELARILDELKTERAQAEVDRRRTLSAFADAVGGESFDQARAKEAADLRVASAERLRDAVTKALARIHALLKNDQRERLAYLIRTGSLPYRPRQSRGERPSFARREPSREGMETLPGFPY